METQRWSGPGTPKDPGRSSSRMSWTWWWVKSSFSIVISVSFFSTSVDLATSGRKKTILKKEFLYTWFDVKLKKKSRFLVNCTATKCKNLYDTSSALLGKNKYLLHSALLKSTRGAAGVRLNHFCNDLQTRIKLCCALFQGFLENDSPLSSGTNFHIPQS